MSELDPEIAAVLAGDRRWTVAHGDCRDVLATLPENSIPAAVCDPPYGLGALPDPEKLLRAWLSDEYYAPGKGGFMSRKWDAVVPGPVYWKALYRVLRPGAHCLVFAGARTVDLMGLALRLAGFEIRDQLAWIQAQGMPKSVNLARVLDEAAGIEQEVIGLRPKNYQDTPSGYGSVSGKGGTRQGGIFGATHGAVESGRPITRSVSELAKRWDGWGTGLRPSIEPILLCRKPLDGTLVENVTKHEAGGIHVDACRIATDWSDRPDSWKRSGHSAKPDVEKIAAPPGIGINCHEAGRWPPNVLFSHSGCEEGQCSEDCPVAELDRQSGELGISHATRGGTPERNGIYGADQKMGSMEVVGFGDAGRASRFFPCFRYEAKAARNDRDRGLGDFDETTALEAVGRDPESAGAQSGRAGAGRTGGAHNVHPTCKPTEIMRWLVKLVTPPDGVILDPFAGSGSTILAALLEGFRCIGIELNDTEKEPFVRIARARCEHVLDERPVEEKKPRFGKAQQGKLF